MVLPWNSLVRTKPSLVYFFLLGRWVRAEAAALFAAALDLGLRSTLPAAEAAFRLVTSRLVFLVIACTSLPTRPHMPEHTSNDQGMSIDSITNRFAVLTFMQ